MSNVIQFPSVVEAEPECWDTADHLEWEQVSQPITVRVVLPDPPDPIAQPGIGTQIVLLAGCFFLGFIFVTAVLA